MYFNISTTENIYGEHNFVFVNNIGEFSSFHRSFDTIAPWIHSMIPAVFLLQTYNVRFFLFWGHKIENIFQVIITLPQLLLKLAIKFPTLDSWRFMLSYQ